MERTLPSAAPLLPTFDAGADEASLADLLHRLASRWRLLLSASLIAGALGYGASYLVAPVFTATTTFLPPQPPQSGAMSALAALGPLAGLAAGTNALRTPADQYIALMQSVTVSDRIVEQFKLMEVYDERLRVDARRELADRARFTLGRKDGLLVVQVDDTDPKRAADIANRYVDELRRFSATIAITEAQQRRVFFEQQMQQTRDQLTRAQQVLQASGFSEGAIKAEPKAAADGYARLRAEATAAEVKLQTLRGMLSDATPEVQQQQATLAALRSQLARQEQANVSGNGADYVSKYREFKYQETLFDLFARQYEMARVDESREGALIQIVDPATPPEKKSKPRRSLFAGLATLATGLLLVGWVLLSGPARGPRADISPT